MDGLKIDTSAEEKRPDLINNRSSQDLQRDDKKKLAFKKGEKTSILEKEPSQLEICNEYYEFKLCREEKYRINKSLLSFRITQFIWYGGGILPSVFLGIFLKQRGLTIVELSSVFSIIFIFQFISSFVIGIITDKIGNAKPVLMFLMLSSSFVLLLMLLTPNINSTSCTFQKKYLNSSDLSEHRNNFSLCFRDCLFDNKKHKENNTVNSVLKNISEEIYENKSLCNNSFTNSSLESVCCNKCVKSDCITERNGFLVVVYSILILAYYSVYSTTYRFLNYTAMSLAEKNNSHYGKEYAFAKSADLIFMIVIAFVLSNEKTSGSAIDFNPVICIGAFMMFCAFLVLFTIKVPILPPGKNLMNKAFTLIRDIDMLAFTLLNFVSGNGYVFYFTFHLVFFESIDASSTAVAFHTVAIVLYGFLLLLTSKWWMNRFGSTKVLVIGLFLRGVNFAAYSYVYNPWWSLVIDISSAFADDLYWVAVVTHCWRVAPVGFAATLIASIGSVHYGIGRSSGVFFGGMMINYMGLRTTYRIMSAIFFGTAISYSIFTYKRCQSSKIVSK